MHRHLARSYRIVARVVFAGIILQFAAAGLLIFRGMHDPHLLIGTALPVFALVGLLLAIAARMPGRALALQGLLLGLLVGQHLILLLGLALPSARILHIAVPSILPLVGLALARWPLPDIDAAPALGPRVPA